MPREALRAAGRIVGSMQALAEKLNITKGAVSQWDRVPAERVIDVAQATGWVITPHQLRPDIYPNSVDAIPPDALALNAEHCPSAGLREQPSPTSPHISQHQDAAVSS